MKVLEILIIICTSLFFLLSVFLLSSIKSKNKGFGWLGIFFLLLSINLIDGILMLNGTYLKYPSLALWEDPFVLLYGPLILFFSKAITQSSAKRIFMNFIHFVPFILFELIIAYSYHFKTSEEQYNIMVEFSSLNLPPGFFFWSLLIFAHAFAYIIYARQSIKAYLNSLKQYYSLIEISWSVSLIDLVLLIFTLSLITSILQYFVNMKFYQSALLGLISVAIFFTFNLLLKALKKPIFRKPYENEFQSKISIEEETELKHKIKSYLQTEKPFTDPNFSLKDLSDKIEESSRKVSYVINKTLARNFYDLINDYRINEAKSILSSADDPKITLLEVLYQVGFNSKSSFNTQFKKKMGITPSEYRKSLTK